jgi:membrane-bound metal-dependent hydrolase YbcI (DUF457 family)
MDTITHGIAGALIGKGFFSENPRTARVATFAATVGAMFPDIDIVRYAFSSDPLAIVKYHRAITHSFFALPLWAFALAWLTRAALPPLKKKFPRLAGADSDAGLESPSLPLLTLFYAIGIASHIFLDGMTSFGTRMWTPLSQTRVAWDILFIIDFVFTALVLVPQIAAWVFSAGAGAGTNASSPTRTRTRGLAMWLLFTLGAVLAFYIARAVGFGFHAWIIALTSAIFALIFFAPAINNWGARLGTPAWCRAGVILTLAYLCCATYAHHLALQRVLDAARAQNIPIARIAALPLPPSLLSWGGNIRTPLGVDQSRFDLRHPPPPDFHFTPDSPPDPFISRALALPEVQLYLGFARFPVIHSTTENGLHAVDFNETRFIARQHPEEDKPTPFSYRVVFDSSGTLVEEGWQSDGLNVRRMSKILPPRAPDPKNPK